MLADPAPHAARRGCSWTTCPSLCVRVLFSSRLPCPFPALLFRRAAGLGDVEVDDTDSKMDVWDLEEDAVASAIAASSDSEACSHARRAAQRRLEELRERQQIRAEEKTGVHWGDPKYEHLQTRDINAICARVCIYDTKPAAPAACAASVGESHVANRSAGLLAGGVGLLGVAAVVALRGRRHRLCMAAVARASK